MQPQTQQKSSKIYVLIIVAVAAIGGLLFGFDTSDLLRNSNYSPYI